MNRLSDRLLAERIVDETKRFGRATLHVESGRIYHHKKGYDVGHGVSITVDPRNPDWRGIAKFISESVNRAIHVVASFDDSGIVLERSSHAGSLKTAVRVAKHRKQQTLYACPRGRVNDNVGKAVVLTDTHAITVNPGVPFCKSSPRIVGPMPLPTEHDYRPGMTGPRYDHGRTIRRAEPCSRDLPATRLTIVER